ncbi:hypothetical protein GCM10027290_32420 [Micromonospora sonneratiae]
MHRRTVAVMANNAGRWPQVVDHPSWCVQERCGYVVPPRLTSMLPWHRGVLCRAGNLRFGGIAVTHLIGTINEPPLVAVHTVSRACGHGLAELRLVEAWQLARHLDALLTQAGFTAQEVADDGRR